MSARDTTKATIDRELSLLLSRLEKTEEIEMGYLGIIIPLLFKAQKYLNISYMFEYETYKQLEVIKEATEDE